MSLEANEGTGGNSSSSQNSSIRGVGASASSTNTLSNQTTITINNPVTVVDNSAGLAQTLRQANAYTDLRFGKTDRQVFGMAAGAAALANLPQAPDAGSTIAGFAVGGAGGQSAFAAGLSRYSDDGQWLFRAGASLNSQGVWSGGAGIGFVLH